MNKSYDAHHELLASAHNINFDVIALQEPGINFTGLTCANHEWKVVYPDRHHDHPHETRSVLFISSKIPTNLWRAIATTSSDLTALLMTSNSGKVLIFNVYNDCNHSRTLEELRRVLLLLAQEFDIATIHMLWLGDFNRHHPMWDEARNNHLFTRAALDDAEKLIDLTQEFNMLMALPQGIPTLEHSRSRNLSRPDNVFCSNSLVDLTVSCDARPELRPALVDHFPILSTFDLSFDRFIPPTRRNFRKVDWEAFFEDLEARLAERPAPSSIATIPDLRELLDFLSEALEATIGEHVPIFKQSPFMRRWWTQELTDARKKKNRLQRRSYRMRFTMFHPVHEEARIARNDFVQLKRDSKKKKWNDFLSGVSEQTIWIANRYATSAPSDGSRPRMPVLEESQADGSILIADTNEVKAQVLYRTFFRAAPTLASLEIPTDHTYPEPKFAFRQITEEQIHRQIQRLSPHKAPGPNGVPNVVYIECAELLVPYLIRIFRATFTLDYYPPEWKRSRTVVLRKPSRATYKIGKSYRPIALLDCGAKILSACVAEDISYEAEKHALIPANHFGGRTGRTTTDALHYLIARIKNEWRKGNVVAVVSESFILSRS